MGIAFNSLTNIIYVSSADIGASSYTVQKFDGDGMLLGQWSSPSTVQDYDKLPFSYKNLQPSHIQSTQEELKEPQEMEAMGNSQQPRAEDPIANLYKLDLAKFMYTLVMIDRKSKTS
jgi:hypothetical protein